MRLLAIAVLALLQATAAAAGAKPALFDNRLVSKAEAEEAAAMLAKCPAVAPHWAYRVGEPLKPRKLSQLPPANMYAAVFHHVGICEVPIVVKYGVGADR